MKEELFLCNKMLGEEFKQSVQDKTRWGIELLKWGFVLTLFLLLINVVSAGYSITQSEYIDGDWADYWAMNGSTVSKGDSLSNGGWTSGIDANDIYSTVTANGTLGITATDNEYIYYTTTGREFTDVTMEFVMFDDGTTGRLLVGYDISGGQSTALGMKDGQATNYWSYGPASNAWQDTGYARSIGYHTFITYWNTTVGAVEYKIDGQACGGRIGVTNMDRLFMMIESGAKANISYILFYNGTVAPQLVGDTDPPNIDDSTWNMTSEGGCTVWTADKTIACNTTDSTPTVKFDTDEAANCRIYTQDQNFTTMGTDRNCTTTGGTSHICTLIAGDALTSGIISNLTIGCEDAAGNENKTSSSGFLKINYTAAGGACTPSGSVWTMTQSCVLSSAANYDSTIAYVPSPYALIIEADVTFQRVIIENGGTYAAKR